MQRIFSREETSLGLKGREFALRPVGRNCGGRGSGAGVFLPLSKKIFDFCTSLDAFLNHYSISCRQQSFYSCIILTGCFFNSAKFEIRITQSFLEIFKRSKVLLARYTLTFWLITEPFLCD